ncbi:uncharacterized protein LOC112539916 [Tetranychus urticae]|uniref:BACK domain-containing protein n=1 Tax=Tetranychus urticae TaxID=32264 RepID=T1JY84_TETUR|nr:uncharacterized protein LOC112539916 [Tetranychus urticae]
MDSLDTDDQLTIVNRSTEYKISKKLICKVPYFEKLLSHECLESKEDKVVLDFDEQAFKLIMDWVRSHYAFILIEMNHAISLYELADYLGLDWISKMCITCFSDNFSTKNLPTVVPKVTATSKCITSGALNAYICRYFSKIVNTTVWLEYPIETIEYICALDLLVYSEYQVFIAVLKWVNYKADTRKAHLKGLLKLVRWCHLNEQDLSKIKENELFKSSGFEPIFCAPRKFNFNCNFNRAKQSYFVMIEKLNSTVPKQDPVPKYQSPVTYEDLRINVLDNNMTQLFSQVIKYDGSIPLKLFHDEHVSEIFFESKSHSLRIGWNQNKFTWVSRGHYPQLLKRITGNFEDETHLIGNLVPGENFEDGSILLEGSENFIMISIKKRRLHYFVRPTYENYAKFLSLHECKATILNDKLYLLSNALDLYEFEIDFNNNALRRTWSHCLWNDEFRFENLLLTSNPAGDKIICIDKLTKKFICFDVNTKVSSKGRMITYSYADGYKESNSLFTFTSTFLPLNTIRTCLNSKSNSEN